MGPYSDFCLSDARAWHAGGGRPRDVELAVELREIDLSAGSAAPPTSALSI